MSSFSVNTDRAVSLTLDAWPHLLSEMRHRTRRNGAWSGRLSPRQKEIAVRINAETRMGERVVLVPAPGQPCVQ